MGIFNRRRQPRDKPARSPGESWQAQPGRSADWRANTSEAICAAAARLARTLSSAPLHLYKEQEVQRTDPLERLVRYAPAPGWNACTFVRDMEFARNSVGRCYALIRRDTLMQPLSLWYVDPARVTTLWEKETDELWHRLPLGDGQYGYVHDSDMFWLSFLSTSGGITPTSVLRGTLEYDAQVKEFSLKQLDGVHDVILINVPGNNLSGDRRTALIQDILSSYKASGKSALVLDSGITATRLASSPVDPHVLDVEKVTKSRVSGVYGMNSHLLGDGESSKSSSEEDWREYMTMTVTPAMTEWEAEMDRKLLTWKKITEGYHFAFDSDALGRANTAAMAEKHFKAVRGAWMKPNEVRKREGLPPDPNGGDLMISRDLLPLSLIVNHPEMLLQSARGKTNGAGEDA